MIDETLDALAGRRWTELWLIDDVYGKALSWDLTYVWFVLKAGKC